MARTQTDPYPIREEQMRATDAREETVSAGRAVASLVGGRTLRDAPGGRQATNRNFFDKLQKARMDLPDLGYALPEVERGGI